MVMFEHVSQETTENIAMYSIRHLVSGICFSHDSQPPAGVSLGLFARTAPALLVRRGAPRYDDKLRRARRANDEADQD